MSEDSTAPTSTPRAEFTYQPNVGEPFPVVAKFLTRKEAARHGEIMGSIVGKGTNDPEAWAAIRAAVELGVVSPTFDELEETRTNTDLIEFAQTWPVGARRAEDAYGRAHGLPRITLPGASPAIAEGEGD